MALLSVAETRDTVWEYMPELNRPVVFVYYLLLTLAAGGIAALFICHITVDVQATGIVRPALERTEIHAAQPGVIDTVFVKEGDTIVRNGLILSLRPGAAGERFRENETACRIQQAFVADLEKLTIPRGPSDRLPGDLQTAVYREEAAAFLSRAEGQRLNWIKAAHEIEIGQRLVADKIISPKEFYDQRVEENKMRIAYGSFWRDQRAAWQEQLADHREVLAGCLARRKELQALAEQREVRATVAGVVQGIRTRYPGGPIRPEETICAISPEGDLVGECYVTPQQVGMLRPGLQVRIRVDAFQSLRLAVIGGEITSVGNDFMIVGDRPVFLVRCRFFRRDGGTRPFETRMKKGLTFHMRCAVGERTLFRWLSETIDSWFEAATNA